VFDPDVTDITKLAVIHTATLSEFADTKDVRGGGYIKFPRRVEYRDAAGTTHWSLTSVRINASIPPDEFAPKISAQQAIFWD
jgi:outer membrane lipoprotein-sorting protein